MRHSALSRLVLSPTCAMASLLAAAPTAPAPADWGGDPIAPIVAPFPMPPLSRPQFPARVVDLRDHGARPDGTTQNTGSIAAAIAACAAAGGGRVLVPAGRWLTGRCRRGAVNGPPGDGQR